MNLSGTIINNRYKVDKKIAEGNISIIYLAYDLINRNKPVTVKILKNRVISSRIEDVIRFRSEVNGVAQLEHKNIIKIYEVGEIIELQYIIMENFTGQSLWTIFNNNKISIDSSLNYMLAIYTGLNFIHRHKIIHRDLKLGNILVNNDDIKIIDFGLSHIKEFDDNIASEDITGTFGYMSPEQGGMIKKAVDERSDLYSTGVIFYQLLTGKMPFEADNVFSLAQQQVARIPENPRSLNNEIPEILDKIIMKLLEKEPEKRYQSAKGVSSDLEKYIKGQREFILGLNDRSIKLSYRTRLIGRSGELERLKSIYKNIKNGAGCISFLTGEAGSGKTKLSEEFKKYIYAEDGVYIDGKCSAQNPPYGPFSEALNIYVNNFNNYDEKRKKNISRKLKLEFRNLGEIIIGLNSSMQNILGKCPPLVSLGLERENRRFQMIVSQFFLKLSAIENGLVIFIDEMRWTDEGTLNLIYEIAHDISSYPLLIVCIYRKDEVGDKHRLKIFQNNLKEELFPVDFIQLELFDSEMMNEFISSLLLEPLENTKIFSDFILNRSRGNPYFAIEILKQLIDEKILFYENNIWNFDVINLNKIEISKSIVDLILKRINLLDDNEKYLLSVASVIGNIFDIKILFKLSGIETGEVIRIIDRAIALHLLVDLPVWGDIGFAHEKIKEAFYLTLEPGERKTFHLLIALVIEEMNENRLDEVIFELAHHYIEGGDAENIIKYAYPAALNAEKNHANEEAIRYYELALKLLEQKNYKRDSQWVDIQQNMSRVYLTIGKTDNAIDALKKILPFMKSDIERAYVYRKLTIAYFKKGDWKKCEEFAKLGLSLLGEKLPVKRKKVILSIFIEIFIHILHNLMPALFIRSKPHPKVEYYKIQSYIYISLTWSYILSDTLKFIRASLRAFNFVESKIGKSNALAMVSAAFGGILMALPLFNRALKYHNRSLKMRDELADEWGIAQSNQWIGFTNEWMGNYNEAYECFTRSSEKFKYIGDVQEMMMSLSGIIIHYYLTANLEMMGKKVEQYSKIANISKDNFELILSWIYYSLYYLLSGDLKEAEQFALKVYYTSSERESWMTFCISNIILGILSFEQNEIKESVQYLQVARDYYEKNYFIKQYTIFLYPCLADAYLAEFSRKKTLNNKKNIPEKRKIKKACVEALRRTKKWPSHYGSTLRVTARYFSLIGKNSRAKIFFLKSIEHNKVYGRKYELGRALYEYGLFLEGINEVKKSRENLEAAYQVFSNAGNKLYIGRLKSLLGIKTEEVRATSLERLVDKERFLHFIRMAKDLNLITDVDELLNRVLINAMEITGAQKGYIYIVNGDQKLEKKSAYPENANNISIQSINIVESVFRNEKDIIIQDAKRDKDFELLYEHGSDGFKSILCVPIKIQENKLGVCYLENSLSSCVFTQKEADILQSFLSQIAFVINNILQNNYIKSEKGIDKQTALPSLSVKRLEKVKNYINENYASDLSREGLGALAEIHPDTLGKYFKMYMGKKISDYINELRIKDAAKRLRESDERIIEIAYSVGFESLRTFNQVFRDFMKVSPTKYRKNRKSV